MSTEDDIRLVQMNVRVHNAQKAAVDIIRAKTGISRDEFVRRALTAALRAADAPAVSPRSQVTIRLRPGHEGP